MTDQTNRNPPRRQAVGKRTAIGRKKQADGAKDRQFVTGLARGLSVLRCFTPQRTELGTTDISRLTGLPQPTVWRLCHTLVKLGYLVNVPDREKLRVGAPVLSLGYAAVANLDYVQVARPHMQELANRFGAAVALGARHRLSMVYLERCQGDSVLLMNLQQGSRIPLYISAMGWAYMAGLADGDLEEVLEEMKDVAGKEWAAEKKLIGDAIEFHRKHRFVLNSGLQHPGITAVGVPVRLPGGGLVAITLSTWNSTAMEKVMLEEAGPALVRVAELLELQSPQAQAR